jgi:hypothetical protein
LGRQPEGPDRGLASDVAEAVSRAADAGGRGRQRRTTLSGALAGAAAALVWAAQQPLDKRVFRCGYDDVELLGKLVTRGRWWPVAGLVLHVQNGALFGAVYARLKPSLPGPPIGRALLLSLAEHFATWPLTAFTDARHPARGELTPLRANRRALAQSTWRHALFGAVLGGVEEALNRRQPPGAVNGSLGP